MSSWGRGIGLGILAWLVPFIVAFVVFPLRNSARPVFESVMAVTVAGTAVGLGLVYLRAVRGMRAYEGLTVGALWLAMCVLIDAPLMLLGGPMHMSLSAYLGDIGLTYVTIPLVTSGLGAACVAGAGQHQGTEAG
jgi:hypothetical protein